jgi:5-methylcytosine-specific restriction endonuclease McrA
VEIVANRTSYKARHDLAAIETLRQLLHSDDPAIRRRIVRNARQYYLVTDGPGPHTCEFCGKPVTWADGHVHHRDRNPANNVIDNLTLLHPGCHSRLHAVLRRIAA